MGDYTATKDALGGVYPFGAIASTWDRLEPLLSAEQLVGRFLFGIPLVSQTPNFLTGKVDVITAPFINDLITGAVSSIEEETHCSIMPTQVRERHPFDRFEFASCGYFRVRQRPCASIQELAIESSSGDKFFVMPLDWVETGFFHQGQLNILPLSPASASSVGNSIVTGGPAAAIFLSILGQSGAIPAYWTITYTVGFPDGLLPRMVNDLVGIQVAMDLLSMLGATNARTNSTSLSIDGMSQSVSTPGPNIYAVRIQDLATRKAMLAKKLKAKVGQNLFSGNV